jgi:hypothetical protein
MAWLVIIGAACLLVAYTLARVAGISERRAERIMAHEATRRALATDALRGVSLADLETRPIGSAADSHQLADGVGRWVDRGAPLRASWTPEVEPIIDKPFPYCDGRR